jgi:hypothetical protein
MTSIPAIIINNNTIGSGWNYGKGKGKKDLVIANTIGSGWNYGKRGQLVSENNTIGSGWNFGK